LIGTVERTDLTPALDSNTPARAVARLDGRTIRPDAVLSEALDAMKRGCRRRLAVTTDDSTIVGLLCLKGSGLGFCSDADVRSRQCARSSLR
jgi:hypothetical protein